MLFPSWRRALAVLASFAIAGLAQAQAPARLFLWEVSSLTNRAYLYGTVHAGKKTWFPLPAPVEEAFEDSKYLVVEADITDTEAIGRSGAAMLLKTGQLKDQVDADDYARFVKLLPRYGLKEPDVKSLKPFMAVSILVFGEWARNAYFPQYGIDGYLIRKARAELKPVLELEGVDTQTKLMQSLTPKEESTLFASTVTALADGLTSDQINGLVKAWQEGDAPGLLEIARKYNDLVPGAKEFEEKFIWSRHEDMVRKIEGYLNDSRDRHFIAVGSLHLAGERGLVEMLKKRGYMVRQR